MYCSNCGTQYDDSAKFCPSCGAPSTAESTANYSNYNNQNTYQYTGPMGQTNTPAVSKPNIIGIVAGVLAILCTFLPYVKASFLGLSESESLIGGGDGVFFIILGILAIVFSVLNKEKIFIGVAVATCLLTIFEIVDFNNQVDENILGDIIEKGFGYYLMIIAAIVMAAAVPAWKVINKNKNM